MTEKQFEIICEDSSLVDVPVYVISDEKLKFDIYASKKDAERLCTLLNEYEQLKKDVEYWKQVASQYTNELNVFKHCKKHKTECKDIYWSGDVDD